MSFSAPATLTNHAPDTAGGAGIADGDKGDITVSASGATWLVDNDAVAFDDLSGVTNLPGGSTSFLRGDGTWAVPAGTGSTAADQAYARRAPFYPPFTPAGGDDEFDDASFTGWTAVQDSSPVLTLVESNDMLSILHPGGDSSAELHAWMKTPASLPSNFYVEAWMKYISRDGGNPSFGVIMADGTTYGAGTQVGCWFNASATTNFGLGSMTNYNTTGTISNFNVRTFMTNEVGIRLQYLGSNNWAGFTSVDGISWINVTGTLSRTMTPTVAGFFVSSWGVSQQQDFAFRYVRFV